MGFDTVIQFYLRGTLILTSPLFPPLNFFSSIFVRCCSRRVRPAHAPPGVRPACLPASATLTRAAPTCSVLPAVTLPPQSMQPYLPITDANGARDGNHRGCPHPFVSWGRSEPASEPNILLRGRFHPFVPEPNRLQFGITPSHPPPSQQRNTYLVNIFPLNNAGELRAISLRRKIIHRRVKSPLLVQGREAPRHHTHPQYKNYCEQGLHDQGQGNAEAQGYVISD
jgi:hypothetical protein